MCTVTRVLSFDSYVRDLSPDWVLQSEQETSELLPVRGGGSSTQQHNVEFLDEAEKDILSFPPIQDKSFKADVQPQVTLPNFLERPAQIYNFTWGSGFTPLVIRPWELFFDNTAVKAKLANFAYLSCNLHVEIKINSTPFNYGSMLFAYHPHPKFSPNTLVASNTLDRICRSQRPHVWAFPQENSGGTMELPFFNYKNFLRVNSRQEFQDMGEIDILEYAPLTSANGVIGTSVSVQIFAWATDVVLTGGTTAGVLQAADDEYSVDPISRPANAVALAAAHLTSVPTIGPYAKATEIGARAVSSIAKIFGFTDVPVISNSHPYKSLPFNGLASAEISEPKDKFTLDPKAELTIDPRTVGLSGVDELAIPYIVQKESFLTNIDWNIAQLQDTQIFNMAITPSLRDFDQLTNGIAICFTPMSHVAQLFNNWRGDIVVRFKFISTDYHRGRVRISWDPLGDLVTNTDTMNTVFTKIVDLAIDKSVEFRIPYMQAQPWMETRSIGDAGHPRDWQLSNFTDLTNQNTFNGTLTMRVLTQLSAPVNDANIKIMTFVRGASNLEFANPININDRFSQFNIQSGLDETETVEFGKVDNSDDNRYLLNYGESVTSLRTLLRRSVLADIIPLESISAGNNSAYVLVKYRMNKYPIPPGFNPDVFTRASTSIFTSTPYAFTHMTPFNWIQSAYVGCRGSMQWQFNMNANGASPVESIKLVRTLDTLPTEVLTAVNATNGANLNEYSSYFQTNTRSGIPGQTITNQRTQASLSAELNQFNQNRFVSCSNFNTTKGLAEDNTDRETYILELTFANEGRNDIAGTLIERYCSIGTDFNFFFYLNAPITYHLDDNVTPN